MSQESQGKDEKISPAEKARRLAREVKAQREEEEHALKNQKVEQYSELTARLQNMREALVIKRQDLQEVQEGLREIDYAEKEGLMSDALTELRAQLKVDLIALEAQIQEDALAIEAIEADPLLVEMTAIESASKAEADRISVIEQESRRKKEAIEQVAHAIENLDTIICDISAAMKIAEKREERIRSLREEKAKMDKQYAELAKTIEKDVDGLLAQLSEKHQRAIADAVAEALKHHATIAASSRPFQEARPGFRPAASTLSEWFSAWREQVTPSIVPFVDKPLRTLRAFEHDERLEKARVLLGEVKELTDTINALFDERKKTNVAYIERFLAPEAALSSLETSLHTLRIAQGIDKKDVNGKLLQLSTLRSKFPILLTDVQDEQYRQYDRSKFLQLSLYSIT